MLELLNGWPRDVAVWLAIVAMVWGGISTVLYNRHRRREVDGSLDDYDERIAALFIQTANLHKRQTKLERRMGNGKPKPAAVVRPPAPVAEVEPMTAPIRLPKLNQPPPLSLAGSTASGQGGRHHAKENTGA